MKQLQPFLSRYFSKVLCIFCASFMLVGCSYFDTGEEAMLQTDKGLETVEVQNTAPLRPISTAEAVARSTGGSVTLYGFDDDFDAAPMPDYAPVETSDAQYVAPAQAVPVGRVPMTSMPGPRLPMVYSADPSVQIFPFEDMMDAPVAAAPPSVMQPARHEEYVTLAEGQGAPVIVYFAHDSAALSQEALAKIAGVANRFNNAAGYGLTVEGHASVVANYQDEAQRRLVNLKVSMDRAFAVASELIHQGIPAEAVRVMAWGDTHPPRPVGGKTPEEAARRVEISG